MRVNGIEYDNPNWTYFAPEKFGGVSVVGINDEDYSVNDNGRVVEGNFITILTECIKIVETKK